MGIEKYFDPYEFLSFQKHYEVLNFTNIFIQAVSILPLMTDDSSLSNNYCIEQYINVQ